MGSKSPVFFDTHTCVAADNPGGIFISGSPGSGKTFTAQYLAYLSTLSGKTTVYLDPKADAVNLINLQGDIGDVNIWDLANEEKTEQGILDPFTLEKDPEKQKLLVMELIETFNGTLSSNQRNSITPILEDVVKMKEPSLKIVVQKLLSSRANTDADAGAAADARALGNGLRLLQSQQFSRLCFDHYAGNGMKIGNGLTIITLLGLEIPDAETDPADYTIQDRLGAGIMLLVTNYIRNIMMNKGGKSVSSSIRPKTVIIDESWAVLATKSGQRIVTQLCRLGRSLSTACILISQNADDIDKYGVSNSISVRFGFRVKTMDEAVKVRESFDLPDDIGIEDTMVNGFDRGDCLMKDFNGNVAAVHIDVYDKRIVQAFNTNPFGTGQ